MSALTAPPHRLRARVAARTPEAGHRCRLRRPLVLERRQHRFALGERAFELWGLPWSEEVQFETLSAHFHPADRDRVRAASLATRSLACAYEIDFRIVLGPEVRWISARRQGADAGIVDRQMFGIFLDVTGRKQAEEGHELLAGEMSHRLKNLLAVAAGLTEITSRSASTTDQNVAGADRAADGARSSAGPGEAASRERGAAVLLGDLFAFDDGSAREER